MAKMSILATKYWNSLNILVGAESWKLIQASRALGGPEALFRENESRLLQAGLNPSTAARIITGRARLDPADEWEKVEHLGINAATIDDDGYPELLREIPSPPPIIYVRGNAELLSRNQIGVVGSRKITAYGKDAIRHLVPPLADYGVGITSGMAFGVDAAALECCMESGGAPIGVLASSLDFHEIAPKSNLALAQKIIEKGCLVSENPPGRVAHKMFFPLRNRIISGLSIGVLIIEAARESGSLITAKAALDQNREVFAVPGSIFSDNCAGTLDLIRKGAKCVTSFQDIASEFGWDLKPAQQVLEFGNEVQEKICDELGRSPLGVNELVDRTRLAAKEILPVLTELEVRGVLRRSASGVYTKVK
jgi:DNA processing protein